jgi:hypothetical protein
MWEEGMGFACAVGSYGFQNWSFLGVTGGRCEKYVDGGNCLISVVSPHSECAALG